MKKIDFIKLNSANVSCNNGVDTEREYEIAANINLQEGKLSSVENGVVNKGDVQVAVFRKSGRNFSPSFIGVSEMSEMCTILTAINNFVADIENELRTNPIQV